MDLDIVGTGLLEGDDPIECSLIDLIVACADESDDAWEIGDRIGSLVESDRIQIGSVD